jgi:hypothetical protein
MLSLNSLSQKFDDQSGALILQDQRHGFVSQKFDDQSGALTLQDEQHGSVSPSVKRPGPLISMVDYRAQIRFRPTPRVTGPVSTSVPVTTSIPEFGPLLHALRSGDSVPG